MPYSRLYTSSRFGAFRILSGYRRSRCTDVCVDDFWGDTHDCGDFSGDTRDCDDFSGDKRNCDDFPGNTLVCSRAASCDTVDSSRVGSTGSALCSPVPMFPGTYVPRTYVPRYLCSPVPMFPGTDVPRFLYFNSRL